MKTKENGMKKRSEISRLNTFAVGLPVVIGIMLLDWWLSFRAFVTVCLLVFLTSAVLFSVSLRSVKGRKRSRIMSALGTAGGIAIMAGGMALFESFRLLSRYGYDDGKLLPFWKPAMAIAILSAAVFVIWILRKCKCKESAQTPYENRKKGKGPALAWWQILLFAILIALVVGFVLYALLVHVNLVLDPAEPQFSMAEVVDKDYDSGGRRLPSTYAFEVVVDGKRVNLPVSHDEYHRGKVGDAVCFYRYEGALGVPFYLSETLSD